MHKFGVFEFDSGSGELRKNGRVVALEPQPAKALALLLARGSDIVSRDELRDAVWGSETHVDFDRGIAYCVSQIRSALGHSGENPRFVQTVPRRGFRFMAPVATDAPPAPPGVVSHVLRGAAGIHRRVLLRRRNRHARVRSTGGRPVRSGRQRLTKLDPERLAIIGNSRELRRPRNIRNLKNLTDSSYLTYVLLGQLQKGETGLRFITHFIRTSDEAHLKANRLTMPDGGVSGLEAAVVEEFERAVREHILNRALN